MSLNQLISKLLTKAGTWYLKNRLGVSVNCSLEQGMESRGIPFIRVNKGSSIRIGKKFIINNGERFNSIGRQEKCVFSIRANAELTIGNNVGISSSTIFCNKEVTIGNNVKIGGNTCIYDTDFHSLDYEDRRERYYDVTNTKSKAVRIGDDVFIGAHSTILKGVTIGDRSIVGAGSVVTKSIPSDQVWGGNPAVFIKHISALQTTVLKAM